MIDELEQIICDWLKVKATYKGSAGVDITAVGPFEDLEDRNAIVTLQEPCQQGALNKSLRNKVNLVTAGGSITFLFRRYDEDAKTIEDAEDRNSVVPDIVFGNLLKDNRLGGKIPGVVNPVYLTSDRRLLMEVNSVIYYLSRLDFQYRGPWIYSKNG
jgi:hypothetical protein